MGRIADIWNKKQEALLTLEEMSTKERERRKEAEIFELNRAVRAITPSREFPDPDHPFCPSNGSASEITARIKRLIRECGISNNRLAKIVLESKDHKKMERWIENPKLMDARAALKLAKALDCTILYIQTGYVEIPDVLHSESSRKENPSQWSPSLVKEAYEFLGDEDQMLVTSMLKRLISVREEELSDLQYRLEEAEEQLFIYRGVF